MKRLWLVLIGVMLALTGCFGNAGTDLNSVAEVALTENNESDKLEAVDTATGELSVLDVKKKYGSDTDQAMMPMYNVAKDERFTFQFKSRFDDLMASEVVTVHTDIKALPKSQVLTSTFFKNMTQTDTVEISPLGSVLDSSDTLDGFGGWGNAPIYYIRINYDLDAPEPSKLEKPIIIPFTIKSEIPVPTLRYEINEKGEFKLLWNPVEGAESYRIYRDSKFGDLLAIENLPVSGPEEAYAGGIPSLLEEVKATEFFYDSSEDRTDPDYISFQNAGVYGEYYVTAIRGGKESNFSNVVSTYPLSSRIPADWEGNITYEAYSDISQLPTTTEVTFIDGSVKSRNLIYDTSRTNLEDYRPTIYVGVEGTALKGYVYVQNITAADLDQLNEQQRRAKPSTGYVEPKNDTEYIPDPNVPTVIEEGDSGAQQGGEPENITESQKENTKKRVEDGDKGKVQVPEIVKEVPVNADSAVEEIVALSMIDTVQEVSLEAFPEAQNFETLSDMVLKVMYQNPLVLGVEGFQYDYKTLTLHIKYNDSAASIKKKQKEIIDEAKKVVASVITAEMSAEDKSKAIYEYLNENTKYDDAALEDAKANGYRTVDSKFDDSFTTYGILVKKVGVCASYASVYKLLGDLAGLESVVVTGDMGGVPHAWNKVKLNNGWVHVDSTNNETNSGVPYLLFNSSDDTAQTLNYSLNNEFWVDAEIPEFAAVDDSMEYYKANGLEVKSVQEFGSKLEEKVKAGETYIVLRLAGKVDEEALATETGKALSSLSDEQYENAQLASLSNYILVYY